MYGSRSIVTWSRCSLLALVTVVATSLCLVVPTESKGEEMSYGEAKAFLAKHTKVIELTDDGGARVAVCPEWQGRVMTSGCDGETGPSFGFINRQFIESGESDRHFNNYGAEDRLWLSPEGGQFSLWFKPGVEQTLADWYTPPAFNEGPAEVTADGSTSCRMAMQMKFENASATEFNLDVTREVRLLDRSDLGNLFGEEVSALLATDGVKMVAYETINTITNRGPAMTEEKGLVSMWMLGMLNAAPKTVVIVPYKPGDESELGPVVKSDYFGEVPADRLKITPEAILFLGDSNCRSKIGTSQKRARNVLGSIDFSSHTLTLVQFTMPDDPTEHKYVNNMWELPQAEPFVGDVANSYNDGPPEPGAKGLGAFYEIESLSPAVALTPGESLSHHHRTLHIQAEPKILRVLAKQVLGVRLPEVRQAMFTE